jgi:hypothetical protein
MTDNSRLRGKEKARRRTDGPEVAGIQGEEEMPVLPPRREEEAAAEFNG